MKEMIRKISVILFLAACELLLGILLLINPIGLTTAVVIGLGVVLIALGIYNLIQYIRLPREEASQKWNLAQGAGFIALGIVAITQQPLVVQFLGTLTTLYGAITLALAFMKLQIMVDAFRVKKLNWHFMGISFLVATALAVLLITGVLAENVVWILTGIFLVIMSIVDVVYYVLSRKTRQPDVVETQSTDTPAGV